MRIEEGMMHKEIKDMIQDISSTRGILLSNIQTLDALRCEIERTEMREGNIHKGILESKKLYDKFYDGYFRPILIVT